MKFNVLTIFPEIISNYSKESILGRGQKAGTIEIKPINIRDFADDKHNTVDDTPYGGGAGMVMKPDPIYKALKSLDAIPFSKDNGLNKLKKIFTGKLKAKKRTILLSPRGRQFDQRLAEKWSKYGELTFICGRYEGVDQRVTDHMIDEEVSIGNYVLAGGELAALVIIEAVSRLIPDVLGNRDSLLEETFGNHKSSLEISNLKFQIDKEYPQYTKPSDFNGWKVPDVLLSGNHKRIEEWRKKL
ncbi:MAG: tRNA (guanosine(37)-N1)-methyltransferase TrmD [Candidatus Magasanikbacteria bacterium CG_4_10_14_0_2_um_filter_37_12]|uniref:tRNA (guanine-N(1)-)-methyltransferase n=1 Tax=Candidatus Magasanikbacteria bacterium CG_4_10_14_0_2_um_filter_37_12 TaxID=1974637 RepID=A0A2M7V9E7_9BACT|nr:MAG: tRNA (guanosine(37)-N1)-methyltransferase TrmD [Candidatus Magasanikbacteria bacterium CG_4_10_14_0_2_um_filter_37_12]